MAEADVLRVADYIARDIRNSTSINTANTSPVLLSLAAGDYYDRRGTSNNSRDDIPYTPALGRSSATYGVSPLTIRYIKSGSRICREVSQVDAGVTTTTSAWIADNVDALSVSLDGEGVATITTSFALRYSNRDGGAGAPTSVFVMKVQSRNPTP